MPFILRRQMKKQNNSRFSRNKSKSLKPTRKLSIRKSAKGRKKEEGNMDRPTTTTLPPPPKRNRKTIKHVQR